MKSNKTFGHITNTVFSFVLENKMPISNFYSNSKDKLILKRIVDQIVSIENDRIDGNRSSSFLFKYSVEKQRLSHQQ